MGLFLPMTPPSTNSKHVAVDCLPGRQGMLWRLARLSESWLQANATAAIMKQMIALGRVGAPEEAAGAMLMLACPYSSYITGQVSSMALPVACTECQVV